MKEVGAKRRLIRLIFAGSRMVIIRRELPRTSAAGRNRLVLSRILLSMLLSFFHRHAPLVQQGHQRIKVLPFS